MRNLEGAATQAAAAARRLPTYLAAVAWLIWLPLMVPMVAALLMSHPSPLRMIISLAGAALFAGIYVWTALRNARQVVGPGQPPTRADLAVWLPILTMLLLSLVLTEVNGSAWGGLFIFTVAAAMGRLPTRQAAALLVGVVLLTLVYGWRTHLSIEASLSNIFWTGLAGLATITMVWSITTSRRWRDEREQLARFASVTEERLRIARDLHDLLGHSLSLIALKSDLAQQLIPFAPERAAAEVADIERAAREALHEVRETVAGYRRPTLAAELHEARATLAAAGIEYSLTTDEHASEALSRGAEAALSWAVREGVTNVIRHSQARHCEIRLGTLEGHLLLEIDDDGVGGQAFDAAHRSSAGNGLRGLGERVVAAGGRYTAGPRPEGGFSLRVWVPLAREESAPAPRTGGSGHNAAVTSTSEDVDAASAALPATTQERGGGV